MVFRAVPGSFGFALAALVLAACGDEGAPSTPSADAAPDTSSANDASQGDTPTSDVVEPDLADVGDDAEHDTRADGGGADARSFPADPPDTIGGDRPASVRRPSDYDPDRAWPAVLLLHGYGASGPTQDLFLGVSQFVDDLGFVLVLPDGTRDSGGSRFWNASDACCNFGNEPVDDVAYLTGLIEELADTHHVDPSRVYSMGHSNGGFMSFGLACRASETFVAIASLAGAAFGDMSDCTPATRPVSVLQVHGTDDETIAYEGGTLGAGVTYPSAADSVAQHAALLGCDATTEALPARDLEMNIAGSESTVVRHTGCPAGVDAELWTIAAGRHIPVINPDGTRQMLEWLLAHRRD